MNTATYFMGVDTGTQSVRVVVTDIKGQVMAGDEQVYDTFYPQAGWAEQKPPTGGTVLTKRSKM